MEQRLIHEHEESLREVLRANDDLDVRLRTLSVGVFYDRDDDIFEVTLGDPQEAITESVRNQLSIRLDPDTLKIVGLEIPNLSARIRDDPMLRQLWRLLLRIAGPASAVPGETEPEPATRLADVLKRELLPA